MRRDPTERPAYSLAEAARYLRLSPATLRSWVVGRPYPTSKGTGHFRPLIRPAQSPPPLLSFLNLIEAHVLRSLRTEHGVPLHLVRKAMQYAETTLRIERLFLNEGLRAAAGRVFLERYGRLSDLSASGQMALEKVFDAHVSRVEWEPAHFPVRLYPFVRSEALVDDRPIVIDARVAFGRPVVARVGVSTHAIVERIDAGESVGDLATDYDISAAEIEQAVLYERAA